MLILTMTMTMNIANVQASTDYNKYSTKAYHWGLGQNKEHKTPSGEMSSADLKKYSAYYIGPHSNKNKVIYLTFDCGYENGYTSKILKTLKKNKVKAIFFVTEDYIRSNPGLVKKMKKDGHLVGNHTKTHPDMSQLSYTRIKSEIKSCEKAMKKMTGYKLDKFIRPPMGHFSKRSLKITQDLGYTTILWSNAMYDYDTAHQPGKQYVINYFNTYYHNGAIPLIHVISKSDTEALPTVIKNLKKKGFKLEQFTSLAPKNPKKRNKK